MTKTSANPRRYSRGGSLDPNQPISVYVAIKVGDSDLANTLNRIEYLSEQHRNAVVSFAGYIREESEVVITLGVNMGPARMALRGESQELTAGYNFLWDVQKILFYGNPVLCAPPNDKEQEEARNTPGIPNLNKRESTVK